jgi:hypothetical protein
METIQYYRAMEAFCRQRAKMDGENDLFWLSEAKCWANSPPIRPGKLVTLTLQESAQAQTVCGW